MEDLIRRSDAIKAVEECLKLLARPRYTVKTAIEAIPSVDIPHSDEWDKYSDKLWKNAYERGKADRPQGEWVPCSERLPKKYEQVLCCNKDGRVFSTALTYVHPEYKYWYFGKHRSVIAWMPLPKPWKGADDEQQFGKTEQVGNSDRFGKE